VYILWGREEQKEQEERAKAASKKHERRRALLVAGSSRYLKREFSQDKGSYKQVDFFVHKPALGSFYCRKKPA
jgi:hypothetical protein